MSRVLVQPVERELPPETLCLETLPPRIQLMVRLLIEHQQAICQYPIGSVELHYHEQRVKSKLTLCP